MRGMTNFPTDLTYQQAFLVLPGFIKALSLLKSPKPIRFLEECAALSSSPSHVAAFILHKASRAHKTFNDLRAKFDRRVSSDGEDATRRRSPYIKSHNFKRRIESLFREGRYSAATGVLEQAHRELATTGNLPPPPARPSLDQTLAIIANLNPPSSELDHIPDPQQDPAPQHSPLSGTPADRISFHDQRVQNCIRRLPKGSANGPSGWTYNTIRRLYLDLGPEDAPHLRDVARFLSSLANGQLPNQLWIRSRAVLLPKPEAGKFRPLGIGEAWYRVLGRCLLLDIGSGPSDLLQPLQLGCGVSGGSEIAARLAQTFLDAHPNHVLIKTDFKNAFNLVPRNLIYNGLVDYCPEILPWFRWAYGGPSDLFDSQGIWVGSNQTGCRQGDPLAPLLFCSAIQDALKNVARRLQEIHAAEARASPALALEDPGTVLAYMDDCTIAVHADLANSIALELAQIFREAGLTLNEDKCRFVGVRSSSISMPRFNIAPEGDIILGNPTGSKAYQESTSLSLLNAKAACLPTLTNLRIDPAASLNIIRYCINPRAGYLARVQEHGDTALKSFDCQVDVALCHIAEHTPRYPSPPPPPGVSPPPLQFRPIDITAALRSLPLHHGGLGISRHSGIAGQLGRLQSRKMLLSFTESHFAANTRIAAAQNLFDTVVIGDANTALEDDVADSTGDNLRARAEAAYSAMADSLQVELIAQGREAHAAWLLSSRFEGSGRWISPPIGLYTPPEITIVGHDYLHALRARLLLHPLEETLISCPHSRRQCRSIHSMIVPEAGEPGEEDPFHSEDPHSAPCHLAKVLEPFHYLDCSFNKGLNKARHDCVVQILQKFLRKEFPLLACKPEDKVLPRDLTAEGQARAAEAEAGGGRNGRNKG
eukprot:gene1693-1849_t